MLRDSRAKNKESGRIPVNYGDKNTKRKGKKALLILLTKNDYFWFGLIFTYKNH
jgi:hypothetical protein